MSAPRFRAVVLAAGLGTRLRPLTDSTPKPLLPVGGRSILEHTLARLVAAGCEAVAINLHHLGASIRETLGDSYRGVPISYSDEKVIQGTLGALVPLREFLSVRPLALLVNGDSLCRWPIARVVDHQRTKKPAATLLVSSRARIDEPGGGVGIERGGRVVALRNAPPVGLVARRRIFAGLHAFSPSVLEGLPARPADIVADLYIPALARGARLDTISTTALWHDLGTPERFLAGSLDFAAPSRSNWLAPSAVVARSAELDRVVIEADVRISGSTRLRDSVVLPGATIGARAKLRSVLVGPEAEIAPGTRLENAFVVRENGETVVRPL